MSPSKGTGVAFDELRQRPYPEPSTKLLNIYRALLSAYGPQHWWPTSSPFDPFEVMVGAILTQAAAWANVEKAIANLRAAGALSPAGLRALPEEELARLVYPAGYYNAKARKLRVLAQHLAAYGDDLSTLFARPVAELRQELLSIHGVGEETADSIILYAAGQPSFVIDAYTRRLFARLGITPERDSYHAWQALFVENLPADAALFNEYHALVVRHAKEVCRKAPRCALCLLLSQCPQGKELLGAAPQRPAFVPTKVVGLVPVEDSTLARGRRCLRAGSGTTPPTRCLESRFVPDFP